MKRFRFPLDRVLRWREEQTDVEENVLRRLLAERTALETETLRLDAERAEAEQHIVRAATPGAAELAALDDYRAYVRSAKQRLARRIAECGERCEQQRQRLMEARRSEHLLDRLRDRLRAGWQLELDRELEALVSETYLARWSQRRARAAESVEPAP